MKKIFLAILLLLAANINFASAPNVTTPAGHWREIFSLPDVSSVVDPYFNVYFLDQKRIFAMLNNRTEGDARFYSDDQGKTWHPDSTIVLPSYVYPVKLDINPSYRSIYTFVFDTMPDNEYFKGSFTPQGFKWMQQNIGTTTLIAESFDPKGNLYIVMDEEKDLIRCENPKLIIKNPATNEVTQTITFESLPIQQRQFVCTTHQLAADASGNIYFGDSRQELFIYSNETKAWRVENNIETSDFGNHRIIAAGKSTVYVQTRDGSIIRSTDAGQTWTRLMINAKDHNYSVLNMIITPADIVYALAYAYNDYGIFKLAPGDTQWVAENSGLPPLGSTDSKYKVDGFSLATDGVSDVYASIGGKVYQLIAP